MDIAAGSNMAARPKMLMCYLCGREYGTKSLPIHIPQCQKKWLDEENKKPKKDRRQLPQPPVEIPISAGGKGVDVSSMGAGSVDEFNEMMYQHWEEKTLEKCRWCERTFRPEALKIHHRSCTQDRPAKQKGTGLTAASLSNNITPGAIAGTRHVGGLVASGKEASRESPGSSTSTTPKTSEKKTADLPKSPKAGGTAAAPVLRAGPKVAPLPTDGKGEPLQLPKEKPASKPTPDANNLHSPGKEAPGTPSKSPASTPQSFAKFCDECGTPFAKEKSKFCSECGARRPGSA